MPILVPDWLYDGGVLRCNGLFWEIQRGNLSDDDGKVQPAHLRILIDSENCGQRKQQTFWHEVIHVLASSHDWPDKKRDEEETATLYGPALNSFLLDNIDEIKWKKHNPEL